MKKTANKLYATTKWQASLIPYTLYPMKGFSSLTFITVLGLFLAVTLALIGTGVLKLPGNAGIPVSPLPISDPVEDDTACNDPYNADCEKYLHNDPEDLTPAQIQHALEEK